MAQAQVQGPTQDPPPKVAIDSFMRFLKDNELSCDSEGPKFVCINAVRTYLAETNNGREILSELLNALFGNNEKPDKEIMLHGYVAMFCILTMLGKGAYILSFIREAIHDGQLPLTGSDPPKSFPRVPGNDKFYEEFCEKQWMFCVPDFKNPINRVFPTDMILPITQKKLAGTGGSAKVFKVQIHACYNKLQDNSWNSPPNKCHLTLTDETSNAFVLKTYTTSEAQKYCETEKKAYEKLKDMNADRRHIVTFYGMFTHKDTYNIIIEQADKGTLEEYFQNNQPPSTFEHIYSFWYNLFNIFNALYTIHNVEGGVNEYPKVLKGWHQDVKPANILVFSNGEASCYDYKFKLADFGNSHFKNMDENRREGVDTDSCGTLTYGAPECLRYKEFEQSSLYVKQKVDIWSFGCILSEAAVWLSKGKEALEEYRQERKRYNSDHSKNSSLGDCFHDGGKVLDTVRDWHVKVRECIRNSDKITIGVLESVEKYMLDGNPDCRVEVGTLRAWQSRAFEKSKDLMLRCSSDGPSRSDKARNIKIAPIFPPASSASSTAPSTESSLKENVPFNQLTASHYPLTNDYLKEQNEAIKTCEFNISCAKELSSRVSEAEKSLADGHPGIAREHFNKARKVIDIINSKSKSETPSKILTDLIREQCCNSWTGLVKCEFAIMDQETRPLSSEQKSKYLNRAKHYADGACQGRGCANPTECTSCEAHMLVRKRGQ